MKRGKFIVLEGLDLSGKTTQIHLLQNYMHSNNIPHIITREPGGTKFSEDLRQIILHREIDPLTELLLYQASRREHIVKKILPALKENKLVISDRFYDSSVAYQGFGRKLNPELIKYLNKLVSTQNLEIEVKPDLTIFIDIPIGVLRDRLKSRTKLDKFESNLDEEFFTRVRNGFIELAKTEHNHYIVDGTQNIETINNNIINLIKDIIN